METVKSFFDSFKEFIWDIIGYFLPGSYVLILLSACIDHSFFINCNIEFVDNSFLVFFIIAYIIGYVVYGIGRWKEDLLNENSYKTRIEEKFKKNDTFNIAKEFLSKELKNRGNTRDLDIALVRDIRSIVMSFIPESDQKIYTFTFRYEVCNNIGNISVLVGCLGLLLSVLALLFDCLYIFNWGKPYIILYIILIISYYPLTVARNYFYRVSISLPFSIYTAKYLNK